MITTPPKKRHFAAVPIPEAAAIDRAAKSPPEWPVHGVTRDEFMRMLWANTESHFDTALDDFRRNASAQHWERMERAMYVYQAVQGYCKRLHASVTPDEDLMLRDVAASAIGLWPNKVFVYVRQQIEGL